jgi:hypothetical protein
MSRILVGSLILNLVDKLSGPAKGAAKSLQDVAAAAKGLNNAGAGAGLDKLARGMKEINDRAASQNVKAWSLGFEKTLARLKVSAEEMQRVKASWLDLQNTFARDKIGGALRGARTAEWRNATVGHILGVRGELMKLQAQAARGIHLNFRPGGFLRGAAGPAVGVGAGYAGGRGIRGSLRAGSDATTQSGRDYLGGLSDAQSEALRRAAMAQSQRFASVSETLLRDPMREVAQVLGGGDKGVEGASGLSETIARSLVTLQALKGKDRAADELAGFMRALDTLGRANPSDIAELLGGFTRAAGVQGRELNLRDLFTTAKRAKSAGAVISNEFIMDTLPSLIADMGSDRAGTSLGSMVAQTLASRATKQALGEQRRLGLRDDKGFRHGAELSNPFTYTLERLIPALQKDGVDIRDGAAVTTAIGKIFSNQVVADLFTKMITQVDQYQRQRRQFREAPGLAAADVLPRIDAKVANEEVVAQANNLAASIAEPVLKTINPSLRSLASTLGGLADALRKSPELTGQIGTGAAAAGGIAAAAVGGLMLRNLMTGGPAAAALTSSATALTGSAAALTAAATRLGIGGAVGIAGSAATAATAAAGASRLATLGKFGVGGVVVGGLAGGAYYIGQGNRELHKDHSPIEAHNVGRNRLRAFNEQLRAETGEIRMQNDGGISAEAMIAAETRAADAGQRITEALNVTARPNVDMGGLLALDAMLDRVLGKISRIGAEAGAAGRINMNSAFSDFGVAP